MIRMSLQYILFVIIGVTPVHGLLSVAIFNHSRTCQGPSYSTTFTPSSSFLLPLPASIPAPDATTDCNVTPAALSALTAAYTNFIPYQPFSYAALSCIGNQFTAQLYQDDDIIVYSDNEFLADGTHLVLGVEGYGGYCYTVLGGSMIVDCTGTGSFTVHNDTLDTTSKYVVPQVQNATESEPSFALWIGDTTCQSTSYFMPYVRPQANDRCPNAYIMFNPGGGMLHINCSGPYSDAYWLLAWYPPWQCQTDTELSLLAVTAGQGAQCVPTLGGSVMVDCTGRTSGNIGNGVTSWMSQIDNPVPPGVLNIQPTLPSLLTTSMPTPPSEAGQQPTTLSPTSINAGQSPVSVSHTSSPTNNNNTRGRVTVQSAATALQYNMLLVSALVFVAMMTPSHC